MLIAFRVDSHASLVATLISIFMGQGLVGLPNIRNWIAAGKAQTLLQLDRQVWVLSVGTKFPQLPPPYQRIQQGRLPLVWNHQFVHQNLQRPQTHQKRRSQSLSLIALHTHQHAGFTMIAIHSSFPTLIALMTSVTRVKHVVTQTKTFTDPGPAGPLSIQNWIAVVLELKSLLQTHQT